MISRTLKAAFYGSMALPMRVSGWTYRTFRAPAPSEPRTVRAHLGPGQRNYLPGWINVDANLFTAKIDVWADLRNRLPFRDGSVDAFYSHHMIEHLPDALLPFHFGELFRCLRPGGVIRVGGPDGENAARKFVEGDRGWFSDFPDPHESLGGKFTNFIVCRGEHLTILSLSYVTELAAAAGFQDIARCRPATETGHPALFSDALAKESESDAACPHTLVVEARKAR